MGLGEARVEGPLRASIRRKTSSNRQGEELDSGRWQARTLDNEHSGECEWFTIVDFGDFQIDNTDLILDPQVNAFHICWYRGRYDNDVWAGGIHDFEEYLHAISGEEDLCEFKFNWVKVSRQAMEKFSETRNISWFLRVIDRLDRQDRECAQIRILKNRYKTS